MEEEAIIKRKYSIPYEMFGEAFITFQKKFVYPRNTVMASLLIVAAALNVVYSAGKSDDLRICACARMSCACVCKLV